MTRWLPLALLASGCAIVAPDLHVTSVSFPTVVANAPVTATPEPWPSHGPSPAASPTPRVPQTFSGQGRADRLGPVHFDSGHADLHVVFTSAVAFNGDFALELHDPYDRFVADLADNKGSFDRLLSPTIAVTDDYYLAVTAADGRWTIRVN